jgi:tRNA threonylcarbamoyladenosine modification (KEOPS) complex Cgi121 subunit
MPGIRHVQVSGILPVHLAAYKALVASSRGKMVTKSLHVEVLAYMSGRSHVSITLAAAAAIRCTLKRH